MSGAVKMNKDEMMQRTHTRVPVLLHIARWSFACLLAGVMIFIINSSGHLKASETTKKTGTPTGMKIEWLQDLKFGAFVRTATGGNVVVAPTGVRTVSTGIFILPGAQNVWTQAQFKITKPTGTSGDDDDDNDDGNDGDDDDGHNSDNDDHDDDHNTTSCTNTTHKQSKSGGKKSISELNLFGLSDTDDNGGSSSDDDDNGGSSDDDDDDGNTIDHCTIRVTLPTTSTTLQIYNSAGQYMTVSDFKPVLSPDGQTLNVGAKLNVQHNQRRGLYQGKFYVTAICE